jgi:putative transposase
MPRQMRGEFAGAIYHVMNRGDRREEIFRGDMDRRMFLSALTEACGKTQWEIHAYCLMRTHFHLVVETPQANLVSAIRVSSHF